MGFKISLQEFQCCGSRRGALGGGRLVDQASHICSLGGQPSRPNGALGVVDKLVRHAPVSLWVSAELSRRETYGEKKKSQAEQRHFDRVRPRGTTR